MCRGVWTSCRSFLPVQVMWFICYCHSYKLKIGLVWQLSCFIFCKKHTNKICIFLKDLLPPYRILGHWHCCHCSLRSLCSCKICHKWWGTKNYKGGMTWHGMTFIKSAVLTGPIFTVAAAHTHDLPGQALNFSIVLLFFLKYCHWLYRTRWMKIPDFCVINSYYQISVCLPLCSTWSFNVPSSRQESWMKIFHLLQMLLGRGRGQTNIQTLEHTRCVIPLFCIKFGRQARHCRRPPQNEAQFACTPGS
jgi:hypothetical protein